MLTHHLVDCAGSSSRSVLSLVSCLKGIWQKLCSTAPVHMPWRGRAPFWGGPWLTTVAQQWTHDTLIQDAWMLAMRDQHIHLGYMEATWNSLCVVPSPSCCLNVQYNVRSVAPYSTESSQFLTHQLVLEAATLLWKCAKVPSVSWDTLVQEDWKKHLEVDLPKNPKHCLIFSIK